MLSITLDKTKLRKLASGEVAKQGEIALMMSLSQSAFQIQKKTKTAIPHWVKTTRKFLQSQVRYSRATPKNLEATVYFTDKVSLAGIMEEGKGRRKARKKMIAVPVAVKRTQRGGISKANRPKQILNRRDTFVKKIDGTTGIWQKSLRGRNKGKMSLLYVFKKYTTYDKQYFHFLDLAEKDIKRNLSKRVQKAFDKRMSKVIDRS